jgi:hypothetical protein
MHRNIRYVTSVNAIQTGLCSDAWGSVLTTGSGTPIALVNAGHMQAVQTPTNEYDEVPVVE